MHKLYPIASLSTDAKLLKESRHFLQWTSALHQIPVTRIPVDGFASPHMILRPPRASDGNVFLSALYCPLLQEGGNDPYAISRKEIWLVTSAVSLLRWSSRHLLFSAGAPLATEGQCHK
jgi:hypothetical protein